MAVLDSAELVLRASRYSGSGNWLDESGNGLDAVPTGSPTWDGEKFTLNGSTQYFTVPDADGLDPGAGSFTAIIVAATHPIPANGRLLNKRANQANGWWDLLYDQPNGRVTAGVGDGTVGDGAVHSASSAITPGSRFVASWRLNRSTNLATTAVDGTNGLDRDVAAVGAVNSDSPFVLGVSNINGVIANYFKGDVYGVALFRTSLSDAEVEQVGEELLISPLLLLLGVG